MLIRTRTLVGAGLFARSLWNLRSLDPGDQITIGPYDYCHDTSYINTATDTGAASLLITRDAAYVITTWDGGCDGDRRDDWDNMVEAWYNDIRALME